MNLQSKQSLKNISLAAVTLSLGLALTSCAGKAKRVESTSAPAPVPITGASSGAPAGSGAAVVSSVVHEHSSKGGFQLPTYEEKVLANGLQLLFVPDSTLPYVTYSMLIRTGSSQDPAGESGLASFVAELLDKGTVKRTAPQIAQELGQMGADFSASASQDFTSISASGLAPQAEELLKNFTEIVMQPAFSDTEIDRLRKQTVAEIGREIDSPEAFAGRAFDSYLFGSHSYGQASIGTLESVKALKKKNIIQHYLRYYRPNNAILAVVGKYTPELAAQVEKSFGAWTKRDVPAPTFGTVPPIEGVQIRLVDKPGLVQAQIRIGNLGIKRKSDDYLVLRVANTILGGAFASRLNSRIRRDLGLTYNIGSHFDALQDTGSFEISTFTKNQTVGQTVSETLKILSDFKANGVTSDEVDSTKGYLKGIFPSAIETPEKLAFNLMILRFYELPDTYLTNYLRDIDRISASDVNRAIKKHIDDKNLKVLVYTSAETVLPQLEPIGKVEVKKAQDLIH
jgi:zinc protease